MLLKGLKMNIESILLLHNVKKDEFSFRCRMILLHGEANNRFRSHPARICTSSGVRGAVMAPGFARERAG